MKTTIIDVRTPAEYSAGSAEGSINIPLGEIKSRVGEIRQMPKPVILCCASGNRSGQAAMYLQSIGIECRNGGSWIEVGDEAIRN